MISKAIKIYCKDYEKIENYEQAVNDETQVWDCHHRLETHFPDGSERPKDEQLSHTELKAQGIYYSRPPEELIFLTKSEHRKVHRKEKKIKVKPISAPIPKISHKRSVAFRSLQQKVLVYLDRNIKLDDDPATLLMIDYIEMVHEYKIKEDKLAAEIENELRKSTN